MAEEQVQRRLAAILAADVVGYSRMMGRDEGRTLAAIKTMRTELLDPKTAQFGGRIFKNAGDGTLAEFPSAVNAVQAAIDLQRGLADFNAETPPEWRIELRIGISLGDVIVEGEDLYGNGVNVAARMEGLSQPGGICVSGSVHEQVLSTGRFEFEDLGEQEVKNIDRPVRAYQIHVDAQDSSPPPASESDALIRRPSIAVLPFVNMSGDPEQEYFADGMAEDIITGLSRFKWMFVIARNSSFTYKGRNVDVRQVGRELGVRYVLEGSVRKASDRLRITVQLVEAETGNHLWAEKYDAALVDVFDLQDRITEGVVAAIEPSIRQAEIEWSRRKRPNSLGAYDLYLRALPHAWAYTSDGAGKAIELLEQALRIDPAYVAAHGLLAWCRHSRIRTVHGGLDPADRAESIRHAREVLASGTDDSLALAQASFVVANSERDYDAALDAVGRALALTPNSANVLAHAAVVNAFAGRFDATRDYAERSIRLSPFDPTRYQADMALAFSYFFTDRYAEAAEAARRAVNCSPQFVPCHAMLVASQACLGQEEVARAAADRLLALVPAFRIGSFIGNGRFGPALNEKYAAALRKAGLPE